MTYSATNTYATSVQLESHVTAGGWLQIADRDGTGTVSAAELATVEDQIESANNIIDAAVSSHMAPGVARVSGNDWLRDRCLEISAYKAAILGGRDAPPSVGDTFDDAMKMLKSVSRGELRVPNLDYAKTETNESTRVPRAINPGRGRRRR